MLFSLLSNPILLVPVLAAIIIAMTVHEFAHAAMAEWLGDPTPRLLGRLTLNPMAHIHPLGFLLLIVAGFGWGNPVPFDPSKLKNEKWGSALVGLAGPLSNLLLAFLGIVGLILIERFGLVQDSLLSIFLIFLVQFNVVLMVFNLIPIPPLDGSKLLFAVLPDRLDHIRQSLLVYGPFILLGLILIDNTLPVSLLGGLFQFFLNGIYRIASVFA